MVEIPTKLNLNSHNQSMYIYAHSTKLAIFLIASLLIVAIITTSCNIGNTENRPVATLDPDPPISESKAMEIAREQLESILNEIEASEYGDARIRIGSMSLRKLQELTQSDLYSDDSPRLERQIWAVQIDADWPRDTRDTRPYSIPYGYGIVGIDAENGDIWLRARYDHEILTQQE